MLNSNRVRGAWWACAAAVAVLAAGCVSAASEESGGGAPASAAEGRAAPVVPSLVDGEAGGAGLGGSVGGGDASSVAPTSSTLLDVASILSEEIRDALAYDRPDFSDYSDEEILALAFHHRALLRDDPWGFDLNDLSTSLGALCWIIWNASMLGGFVWMDQVWPFSPLRCWW